MTLRGLAYSTAMFFAALNAASGAVCFDASRGPDNAVSAASKVSSDEVVFSSEFASEVILPDLGFGAEQSASKLYEIDITVLATPVGVPFLVNVCRKQECAGQLSSIETSFSFFPQPQVGQSGKFLIEIRDVGQLDEQNTVFFKVEKINNKKKGEIRLRLDKISEIDD